MGNICRSPTAVGVMRKFVEEAGLQHFVHVDSAGTHNYCIGEPPHPQAQAIARQRGYDLTAMRARQLVPSDFESYDLLLAMDKSNLASLERMCPQQHLDKVRLLMHYASESMLPVIPDPFGGEHEDFEMALDCIEDACNGLVTALSRGNPTG
jgi:protein-tyrosine phosphatase